MIVLKLILFMLCISVSQCRTPDKVYCANTECDDPISKAKTLLNYNSPDPDLISFLRNKDAIIYMKSAGTNADLWFASIGEKSGFVNRDFLKEHRILKKNLEVVPYKARKQEINVNPDKVQQPHEVFEGTTIYTTETAVNTEQQDSSTVSPITSSNEDVTPSLNSASETLNQNLENSIPNVPSQDNDEVSVNDEIEPDKSVNSEPQNIEEASILAATPKVPPQTEAADTSSDINQNVESSTEKKSESTEEVLNNNSEQDKLIEMEENIIEQSKDLPLEVPASQQLLTTGSGTLKSESIIEVPEKENYLQNTLAKSEQSDGKEQNISFSLNNLDNVHESHKTSTETNNVPNGKSLDDPTVNLSEGLVESPTTESSVNPTIKPSESFTAEPVPSLVIESMAHSVNEPVPSLVNEPVAPSVNEPVSPVKEPVAPLVNEPVVPLVNDHVAPLVNEPIPPQVNEVVLPPVNEVVPPPVNESIPLSVKEVVPPPVNEPVPPPVNEVVPPPVNEPVLPPVNEPVPPPVNEPVPPPVNEPVPLPVNEPLVEPKHKIISPILSNINAGPNVNSVESNENTVQTVESFSSQAKLPTMEPMSAPSTETLLPIFAEVPPTTSETIPQFYSKGAQSTPSDTIMNMEAPPTTEIPTQDLPPSYTYSTDPAPYSQDDSYYGTIESGSTEGSPSSSSAPIEDIPAALHESSEHIQTSTTEALTQDQNTGFFSNMYSTVADIWPSTTESPESPDPGPIHRSDYPTVDTEKADGEQEFSFVKYVMSTYYSIMGASEETKALFPLVGEKCFTDEYCDGTSNDGTNRLLTFLLTTASSVLLFTLGYYYIDNRRQDGRLIGTINSLQRDLLFTTKECEILKEELATTKNKLAGIEDSSFGMDDMVQSLKEEINELKATNNRLRNSLDDNEKLLRVSENTAGELQNTLSEVENTLSELLAERANSEEQIIELNSKIQAFEEEFISVSRERDNFQLKYVSAESALEELKKQKKQLDEVNLQLSEAKNTIELQKHEIEALKDAIKELKSGMSADVDVTSFIDHTEIKAKLAKALQEKSSYETKFQTEYKERTRLSEELKTTQETLSTSNQTATEALTRLEVLGKYFQERESELLKELSAKESLWLSKQGESASTVEKIELLQQEVQRYKEKCDALTLELAEQESSRRTALSEVESRAHSAWLEARAAKRDADAARDEAAALRRKLASLSVADGAVSPHHKVSSPLENVENPVIPPPLPPMFLPPPLLPPLPRPPPLGRLPSPHPPRYGDRRYSPDSRYSPESRYSPDSRYSPETVRYSPDSRYSPRSRRTPYSPRSRRRSRSRERYEESRSTRSRNGPAPPPPPLDTETEYNSDSPTRQPRRRGRYSRHSGPSSGSGCSSESDK